MSDEHRSEGEELASSVDAEAAHASTAAADDPGRSPTQQHLHDAVKGALFSGKSLPRDYEPGTVLGGRYRIVALLGKGGMGEVYRARDLVVDEDVAIKFLPAGLADRPGYLERFVQELRLARQVSHPNVCRVHDLGEVDGRRFISMEYIDGEDLASLLRRIGRLGPEKAVELAHQLCSGMAALHERGILHRDLKPSNIMLDGSGRIRIADFGLASIAEQLREHEYRDGTPAYQAPEQVAGREVTQRSDIYALALVLWEMFVGRRFSPEDLQDATRSEAASSLDPVVIETLERCLDPDPTRRPGSVLAVSAALPGGDPLAQALAAGRLPSPEAVANARGDGGLRPGLAWMLLALIAIFVGIAAVHGSDATVLALSEEIEPPDVLEHRVEEILEVAAVPHGFFMEAVWLEYDEAVLDRIRDAEDPRERLGESDLSAIGLRYHGYVLLQTDGSTARARELPPSEPLDTQVMVDGRGRLRELVQVPPERKSSGGTGGLEESEGPVSPAEARDYDWSPLLVEAGFEPETLEPRAFDVRPPVYADAVKAWSGSIDDEPVTISAASYLGHPVWFRVELDDPAASGSSSGEDDEEGDPPHTATLVIAMLVLVVVALVARGVIGSALATLVRARGDFQGARRLAIATFVLLIVRWAFGARGIEYANFVAHGLSAVGTATLVWLFYLVVEPWARQQWPRSLVSWTRLLQGRWRDRLVGRDLLVGTFAATLVYAASSVVAMSLGEEVSSSWDLGVLVGTRFAIASLADTLMSAVTWALVLLVAVAGLQRTLRHRWISLGIVALLPLLIIVLVWLDPHGQVTDITVAIGMVVAYVVLLVRYGLLSLAVISFVLPVLIQFPLTMPTNEFYGSFGLVTLSLVAIPALLGYWLSTRGPGSQVQTGRSQTR